MVVDDVNGVDIIVLVAVVIGGVVILVMAVGAVDKVYFDGVLIRIAVGVFFLTQLMSSPCHFNSIPHQQNPEFH